MDKATFQAKVGLAEMLKGGVIMDVVDAEQARIAQEAGAVAVMALERVPSQIRRDGGVARASDPEMIKSIQATVSIPVMAKCRIGHIAEARILEALEVDFIDESEVLTPADDDFHLEKHDYAVPFVCGCRDLGEALRRIGEGAAMLRTKGEAGTGNIVEGVRHLRTLRTQIRRLTTLGPEELMTEAKNLGDTYVSAEALLLGLAKHGRTESLLTAHGAPFKKLLEAVQSLRGGETGFARALVGERLAERPDSIWSQARRSELDGLSR
jgi:pyridoxal 5'-phosphate synthase pdxS subunit